MIFYVVYNKAKGIPYKLLFLRRVWSSISPGHDTVADAIFLYPQVSSLVINVALIGITEICRIVLENNLRYF